jgi:hypothetical protein
MIEAIQNSKCPVSEDCRTCPKRKICTIRAGIIIIGVLAIIIIMFYGLWLAACFFYSQTQSLIIAIAIMILGAYILIKITALGIKRGA